MIPKKPAPHLMRGGYRFPACAKPVARFVVWLDASAGEGRSEKIMRQIDKPNQGEDDMRLVGTISILALLAAIPASAAEMPARKPGLWELKMSFENRNTPGQTMQQCIDAATDQM